MENNQPQMKREWRVNAKVWTAISLFLKREMTLTLILWLILLLIAVILKVLGVIKFYPIKY